VFRRNIPILCIPNILSHHGPVLVAQRPSASLRQKYNNRRDAVPQGNTSPRHCVSAVKILY